MADIRITDLVDEKVFEDLNKLSEDIKSVKQQYIDAASELARGLNMKIGTAGDLDKFNHAISDSSMKAQEATDKLNSAIEKQRVIVGQTTNAISRELAEIEKENKAKREAFEQDKSAIDNAERLLGTRQQNILRLADLQGHLKEVKKAQKDLDDQEKSGTISAERATAVRASLIAKQREYQAAIKDLNLVLTNQEKQMQASDGSYQKLSLQLEFMKRAYKGLTDEEKNGQLGKQLGEEIGNLDAHLKDLAADMGEFQRNTGNYAIANQSVKTELKELVQEIALLTVQYRNMSEEEQRSAEGQQIQAKMQEMTVKAAELKDAIGDVNREISSGANDTNTFSAFSEGINLLISGVGGLTAASHALGIGEKDLVKIQTTLQASLAASNALTKAQNILQKESNLMVGVARLQTAAHAAAIKMRTIAEGEGVVATKAATVAQASFNAVAKANPYVLLATGIGLLVAAILGFTKSTKEETEAQKEAREEMEKSKKEYEELMNVTERLKDAREKGIESSAKEVAQLHLLYSAATDTKRSMEERKLATEKLQQLYPDYLGNLKAESIMAGEAKKAYDELNSALIAHAIVKAKEELIEEYAKKHVDSLEKIMNAQQELNKIIQEDEFVDKIKDTEGALGDHSKKILDIEEHEMRESNRLQQERYDRETEIRRKALQKEIEDAQKQADDYEKAMEEIEKGIDISKFLSKVGVGGSGGKTTDSVTKPDKQETAKSYDEIKEIILESTQSIIAERIKLTEKGSKEEYDLTLQYIEVEKELRLIELKKRYDEEMKVLEESYEKEKAALGNNLDAQKALQERHEADIKDLENKHRDQQINAENARVAAMKAAQERYAEAYIASVQEMYAKEQSERNLNLVRELTDITNARAQHLITEEEYQQQLEEKKLQYAKETAEKEIEMLEKVLAAEKLTAEQRKDIAEKLKEAKVELAKDTADAELKDTKKTEKEEKKSYDKRKTNAKQFYQQVSKLIGQLNGLISTIYDNQLQKIDEEQEASEQAHEAEIERIERLEEAGAISKEEAEARKRAAEQRTADKKAELEKKKQELQHKQAVWDKASSIAQATIATALAIAEALKLTWPMNIIMAALVGAMGAVEIATIAATPIPTYAKGTKDNESHPGGYALVGDAGKKEAVCYDGKMWVTPDKPTVVNIPKGAIVYPDADNLPEAAFRFVSMPNDAVVYPKSGSIQQSLATPDIHTIVDAKAPVICPDAVRLPQPVLMTVQKTGETKPIVIVSHDSKKLERGVAQTNMLIRQSILMQKKIAYDAAFANYKRTRL